MKSKDKKEWIKWFNSDRINTLIQFGILLVMIGSAIYGLTKIERIIELEEIKAKSVTSPMYIVGNETGKACIYHDGTNFIIGTSCPETLE